jgi:hypothetical protein
MSLQNRVTPFGEIIAMPERGLFTGNRGIIHDPATRTLLSRRWATKTWLVCSCDFKGVRRDVMGGRSWTELFFLDEATALAAGHRPCFLCRREAAERFRAAWSAGNRTNAVCRGHGHGVAPRAPSGPPKAAACPDGAGRGFAGRRDDRRRRQRLAGRRRSSFPVVTGGL